MDEATLPVAYQKRKAAPHTSAFKAGYELALGTFDGLRFGVISGELENGTYEQLLFNADTGETVYSRYQAGNHETSQVHDKLELMVQKTNLEVYLDEESRKTNREYNHLAIRLRGAETVRKTIMHAVLFPEKDTSFQRRLARRER